jgi:ABC-2 type transport system ATP-binding protein
LIRTRELTRRFGPLTAVDRLNLDIPKGEVFGLLGPDGAGKTTTLRMLATLLNPDEGSMEVAGLDVARHPGQVKDHIGYMAQRFGLYRDLSVEENMRFYAELFGIGRAERDRMAPELMAMTRMAPFRDRAAGKLSGGMKQKLALMCTLLHRPRVLLLDEPTNGVDPVSRRDFWRIVERLVGEGITVLVTTAYLDEAERCDRVGLMYEGKLIRCAPPAELKKEFRDRGLTVRRVGQKQAERPEEPTLEDAFIAFIQEQAEAKP